MADDEFYYELIPTHEGGSAVRILKAAVPKETVVIPAFIENTPVVEIGRAAFRKCKKLVHVTLPDSIRVIGEFAFSDCVNLQSVNLPDRLEEIAAHAFSFCKKLTDVQFPAHLKIIRADAFNSCRSLKKITLPNGLLELGTIDKTRNYTSFGGAFENCTALTEIVVPESVVVMGRKTVKGCTNLVSITLPRHIIRI